MTCSLGALSAEKLAQLREDRDALYDFVYGEEDEEEGGEPSGPIMDVDKAWHGIHYLLNGDADGGSEPLVWTVMGSEALVDEDQDPEEMDEAPPMLLTPEQVRQVAAALAGITREVLYSRYDPQAMQEAGIYPDSIWTREGDEAFDYVADYYEELAQFYQDSAARGDAIVLHIG